MVADTHLDGMHSRRIEAGGIALNVREAGSGPLMLFFHGITANSAVFAPLMARLSNRFTTIAVDQRGHGRSDKPDSGYDADSYSRDIAGLIRAFDRGPAILVGHSLGSRNAVTAAARYPDLVRSVVAIDFTPYIEAEALDALEARVNAGSRVFENLDAVEAYLQARYPNLPAAAVKIRAESGFHPVDAGLVPLASPVAMAAKTFSTASKAACRVIRSAISRSGTISIGLSWSVSDTPVCIGRLRGGHTGAVTGPPPGRASARRRRRARGSGRR